DAVAQGGPLKDSLPTTRGPVVRPRGSRRATRLSRARAREVFPPPLRGRIKVGGMNRGQARKLRNNPTDAEKVLWKHLRLRQVEGHKFRRQQPLGPYIVDFVCLDRKLIVEVDGGQHLEQSASDAKR